MRSVIVPLPSKAVHAPVRLTADLLQRDLLQRQSRCKGITAPARVAVRSATGRVPNKGNPVRTPCVPTRLAQLHCTGASHQPVDIHERSLFHRRDEIAAGSRLRGGPCARYPAGPLPVLARVHPPGQGPGHLLQASAVHMQLFQVSVEGVRVAARQVAVLQVAVLRVTVLRVAPEVTGSYWYIRSAFE